MRSKEAAWIFGGDHVSATKLSTKQGTAAGLHIDLISQAWNSPMSNQHFSCGLNIDVWQYQIRVQRDFPNVDVTFTAFFLHCGLQMGPVLRFSPLCPPTFCGDTACQCCNSPAWADNPSIGVACDAPPSERAAAASANAPQNAALPRPGLRLTSQDRHRG